MSLQLKQTGTPALTYLLCSGTGSFFPEFCTAPRIYQEEIRALEGFYYDISRDKYVLMALMNQIFWPSWKYFHLPGIEEVKDDPEVLGQMVLDHIADEAGTLKDMVFEWTVLNEPFTHHDLIDVLGRDAMVDWFKAARQASPEGKLYVNDFSILSGGGLDLGHQDHYSETIQFLIDNGAPVDGIGLQGHFGDDVTPPERVYQLLLTD